MSNPFLADLEESYTPYSASGTQTPYSVGARTPKRRNSTNPFEILSPENENTTIFDNNDETSNTAQNFASAIADMSADFFQSINKTSTKFDEDVFTEDEQNKINSKVINDNEEPVNKTTTVKTITNFDTNNGTVFDPFQTINDDDPNFSSKRSSIEQNQQRESSSTNDDEKIPKIASSKAKELFHSSMNEIELLASANREVQSSLTNADDSPISPTDLLAAPLKIEPYSSDLSDLSDISPSNIVANDIRSAFDAYPGIDDKIEKDEEHGKFQPITSSEILLRRVSKTAGRHSQDDDEDDYDDVIIKKTGDNDDEIVPDSTTVEAATIEYKCKAINHAKIIGLDNIMDRSDSLDLNYVGQPNVNAQGIINDAFNDEQDKSESQIEKTDKEATERKLSVDIAEVAIENLQPNSLRELVDNNMDFQEQTADIEESIHESNDPFDTSGFDSKAFEAFESRFEATDNKEKIVRIDDDPFASPYKTAKSNADQDGSGGFDTFEPFVPKQPENTPYKVAKKPKKKKDSFEDSDSFDDDDDDEPEESFRIVIRAKNNDTQRSEANSNLALPLLPPPPKSPKRFAQKDAEQEEGEVCEEDLILTGYRSSSAMKPKKTAKSFIDEEFERFFASSENRQGSETADTATTEEPEWPTAFGEAASKQQRTATGTDSPASPQTPLYDEDTSQPLEDYPPPYLGEGWEMMLRHPAKKKLTANRYWKKIFVRYIPETCVLQLFNKKGDAQPFQELPLQASYSLSEISPQQYDQYGKIFTVKVQYIFYRERVGVRPGQIAKVMQGQIQSMGDFAKLGMPVEHSPQISELLKLGSLEYNDIKELITVVEESMFRMTVHRDRALTYRTEEIQCCVQDECYVEQNKIGIIEKQLARVRVFFLAFLNGMPVIEVGINDLRRQGKEVVGRHDILPVVTEEWIRVERQEFHSCVQDQYFETEQLIRLIPPDACQFEMMRFRIRPPKNRELPLQVSAYMNITPSKMELKCDVLVPGCISRKHGQIPCEDIAIRFHIPECWVYFFRVEKHFRYGAVHSTNRRSGKLKGLDRILGTATNPEPQLIEVTAGLAKYEHAYHSIVWRIPKLPKDGQGAYTQQLMLVRLPLSSFDRIPETFYDFVHVEFRMPSTTVSHTTLRSISVNCETPPEKFVRYVAKYDYKIGLNITYDESKPEPEYLQVTALNNGSIKNSGQDDEEHSSEEERPDEPEQDVDM
ncbi:stoned B isoform X3 [Dermatophagoides pteronyssinus]|uniref:stoned B isoform X3 n=1 Tax=Dermatophagoides pteronyssinus TaxID=6956 RepID=UPI003F67BA0C